MMILMCNDRSSYYDNYKQNERGKLGREDKIRYFFEAFILILITESVSSSV
jgi:hypothetical protein